MRKLFLGAVALAAIAIPTAAHAEGSGDINIGYRSIDEGEIDGAVQYGGAAHVGFGNNWNLQVDGQNNRVDIGEGDLTISEGAAHVFYRAEGWAAGGFISYGDALFDSVYGIGVEGQLYLGQFTVGGSVESLNADNFDDLDGWIATLGGDYFITDNLQVGAAVLSVDVDGDYQLTNFNIGGEWRLDNSPFSIYAEYDLIDEELYGEEIDAITIGARWNFGGGTLLQRNRGGASMERGSNWQQGILLPLVS